MRGTLYRAFVISILCTSIANAGKVEPHYYYGQTEYTRYSRMAVTGTGYLIWKWGDIPLFLHLSSLRKQELTKNKEEFLFTLRHSAQLGAEYKHNDFTHRFFAGAAVEYKDAASFERVERKIFPVASLDTVWDLKQHGFLQYYVQAEGLKSPRVFQKISYGYPIYQDYKIGPYVQVQLEKDRAPEFGVGLFATNIKFFRHEIVPYGGFEWKDRQPGWVVGFYVKRKFRNILPEFLGGPKDKTPEQWLARAKPSWLGITLPDFVHDFFGDWFDEDEEPARLTKKERERLQIQWPHVKPKVVRISKNVTRYIMPVDKRRWGE